MIYKHSSNQFKKGLPVHERKRTLFHLCNRIIQNSSIETSNRVTQRKARKPGNVRIANTQGST